MVRDNIECTRCHNKTRPRLQLFWQPWDGEDILPDPEDRECRMKGWWVHCLDCGEWFPLIGDPPPDPGAIICPECGYADKIYQTGGQVVTVTFTLNYTGAGTWNIDNYGRRVGTTEYGCDACENTWDVEEKHVVVEREMSES